MAVKRYAEKTRRKETSILIGVAPTQSACNKKKGFGKDKREVASGFRTCLSVYLQVSGCDHTSNPY